MGKLIQLADYLNAAENSSHYADSLRKKGYGPYASCTLRLTKTVSGKTLPEPALFFVEKHRSTGLIRTAFTQDFKQKITDLYAKELMHRYQTGKESELERIIYQHYLHIAQREPDSLVLFETALFRLADIALSPAMLSSPTKSAIEKATYAAGKWRTIIRNIRKSIRKRGIHPIFIADVSILPIIGPLWDDISLDIVSTLISELGLPLGIFNILYRIITSFAVKKSIQDYVEKYPVIKQPDLTVIEEKVSRLGGELSLESYNYLSKICKKNKLNITPELTALREKDIFLLHHVLESYENIYQLFTIPPGELLTEISDQLTHYYKSLSKDKKKYPTWEEEYTSLKNLHLGGKKYIADAQGALDAIRAVMVGVLEPIRSAKALLDIVRIWPDEEIISNSNDSVTDISHHAAVVLIENDNFYRFGKTGNVMIHPHHDQHMFNQIDSLIQESIMMMVLIFGDVDSTSQEEIEGLESTIGNIYNIVDQHNLNLIPYGPMTFMVTTQRGREGAAKIGQITQQLIPQDNSPLPGIALAAAPPGPGFLTKNINQNLKITSGVTTKRVLTLAKLSWSVGRSLADLTSILSLIYSANKFEILSLKQTAFPEVDIEQALAHILVRRAEPHNLILREPDLLIQLFGVMNKSKQVFASDDFVGDLSTCAGLTLEGPIFSLSRINPST